MIGIKFEIGGRRVDPSNMGDALEAVLLQGIADDIHRKISGIRNPDTGEAPVVMVRGTDLEHLSVEVSGSDDIVRLVAERLGSLPTEGTISAIPEDPDTETGRQSPKAFLCHATEDKPLARRIADDLQAVGIDTFFRRMGDTCWRQPKTANRYRAGRLHSFHCTPIARQPAQTLGER
jgi:hypothetical protein